MTHYPSPAYFVEAGVSRGQQDESIINIRPSQNNRSMIIQNIVIQERVKQITQELIGGYNIEFK